MRKPQAARLDDHPHDGAEKSMTVDEIEICPESNGTSRMKRHSTECTE